LKVWRFRLLVGSGLIALIVFGLALFHAQLLGAGIALGGRAAGYDIRYGRLSFGTGRLVIEAPDVRSLRGAPVLSATRIAVDYSARDAFGGPYLFGVHSLDIVRPKLTIVHYKDGSYNINLPAPNPKASAKPFSIPRIHLSIEDGSAGIVDETRIYAHSRRIAIEDIQIDARLIPAGFSTFTLGLAVLEEGGKFPIAGRGTFDEKRGYELARLRGRTLALGPLVDYALNSTALHVAGGVLNNIDARVYGLLDRSGNMQRHFAATADLDHFQPYLNGITKPLRDGRGALRVYDDGLAIPKVDGSIAGVPVRIAGAIYDLAKPTLRLGITGNGPLAQLLTLSDSGKKLAVAGPVAFTLFVEGDATQPTTLAQFASPRLMYGKIPLEGTSGLVALSGPETAILHAGVTYDGVAASARGRILLQKHTNVDLVASVDAPAVRLPYAAQLLGPMLVHATAVVDGVDANLMTSGVVAGSDATHRLAGTFAVDGRGIGSIGPLAVDGPGSRSLYARVALDRPRAGGGAAYVSAQGFHLDTSGVQPMLPGIALATLPNVSGNLDGNVVVEFAGKRFAAGGNVHAFGVRALGYPIDDLTAHVAVVSPQRVAVDARYRGSLAALALAAGGKVVARGNVDIPVSVVATGPTDAIAQIHDARFTGASVGGVSIDALEATIALRGKAYDVYGARARIAGNDVVASGSFGNGGTLEVSAGDVALAPLRALGLPVTRGNVSAVAEIGGSVAAPSVVGGVAASDVGLANPQAAGLGVSANTALRYSEDTLTLDDVLVRAGPAVASLDGTVRGLRATPSAPRYAFDARVREADIADLARIAKAPLRYPEGSLDADVRVSGAGQSPQIAGRIAIPEGSLNGLGFRDASVLLAGNARDLRARSGRVTIGSSTLGFAAAATSRTQSFALHAPRVELADFNDYFDRGDTLGGRGSIDVAVRNAPDTLSTSGRIRLAHAKVRRFDVGDARADWSTRGRTIASDLALGSSAGRISSAGTVTLPATQPLRDALHRTTVALDAHANDIDLATWLPAAGVVVPVLGIVNANASVRGAYPNITVAAHADLTKGLVQRVPIRTATLDARASRGRATITNAVLAIDNLTANATGSVGVETRAPLDLYIAAQTPDVGALAKTVTGTAYDASGAVHTTLHLTGTALRPLASDVLDADLARYGTFTLPHAHAEIAVSQTRVTLQRGELDLTRGRVLANGFAPIQTTPQPGIGPATAPLALNLTAEKIDLEQFSKDLPRGTVVGGSLDGTVGLGGSLANPALNGTLALTGGSFVGPQEKSKISDAAAQITFADHMATLHDASATVGGGTLALSGRVSVPDLKNPAQSATANLSVASNGAVFNVPSVFRGRVNGTLTVVRNAGSNAVVGGNLAFSSARIPTNALLPKTPTTQASAAPLPISLDLGVVVGDDVRVQGGVVDIGAKGSLKVGGTVSAPTASGELDSTGGTISFYRTFRLQYPSTLLFDPSNGVIPNVDATATTTVDNPPTDVTLAVNGPATQLNVVLQSNPNYSREQILGLLVGAQALGAVSGVQTTSQGAQQNPFQAAAAGQLGTLLTQNVLEPISSQLGGAVGLNNLAINYTPGGGVDLGAQKKIFKNVSAVFAESFSYPQRQSIGLVASPSDATAIQLTFFSQPSSNRFDTFEGAQTLQSSNNSVTGSQPANGSSGFSFSLQRKFR
jgi:autotransporter translocation and assembly factor TamB